MVMAVYNGEQWIAEQLRALAGQTMRDFELVVADNGSSDRTLAVVEDFRHLLPRVSVVDASSSRGQAYARNCGAAAARAQLLVFLDQDDVVAADYLAAMCSALTRFDIVGARIDRDALNETWVTASRRPAQIYALGNALGFLPYAGGQTLGIRKTLFHAIGGFDVRMPGAVEDVDLCWRAQLAGGVIGYAPDAVVRYRYRARLRDQVTQAFGYGRAEVHLYAKYRNIGMARRSFRDLVRRWLLYAKMGLRVRSRGDFARLCWNIAHDAGLAVASLAIRRVYL